jgi:hypothetical protein
MDAVTKKESLNHIGFVGEQILSYFDEIKRITCPKCGNVELSASLVGKSLLVRCSADQHDFNENFGTEEPVLLGVCDYLKLIKPSSMLKPPFTLKFSEDTKRGTAANSAPRARRRRT